MSAAAATGTERRACELIAACQQMGIAKYGTTVANNPLNQRALLQHALEEALDYLQRSIDDIDAKAVQGPSPKPTAFPSLAPFMRAERATPPELRRRTDDHPN